MTIKTQDLDDLDQRADRLLDGMKREGKATGFTDIFGEMFGGRHG